MWCLDSYSWTLTTNRTVVSLGSILSGNSLWPQWIFPATNGDMHLISYYSPSDFSKPIQVWDIDLTTHSQTGLLTSITGRPGIQSTVLYSNNGCIYFTAGAPTSLFEYNPTTAATNNIGLVNAGTPLPSPQSIEIGDDGFVYVSSYGNGGPVGRYNPLTHTLNDWGAMDSINPEYTYTIGADTNSAYCGLRASEFYLCVVNEATTNKTYYFKGQGDLGGWVTRPHSAGWWYERKLANGSIQWYSLVNGVVSSMGTPAPGTYYDINNERQGVVDSSLWNPRYGYTVNDTFAFPFSASNSATITVSISSSTNSYTETNFFLNALPIQQVFDYTNNTTLFVLLSDYTPTITYSTPNSNVTILGDSTYSLYDACFSGSKTYMAGYDAALLDYSNNYPWTLTSAVPDPTAPGVNPRASSYISGHHYYYCCLGSDGQVYYAIQHERTDNGGEIAWYDPVTRTNGSIRTPFTYNYNPTDIKPVLGGTKIIYADTSGNLYRLDVATKSLDWTNAPLGTNVPMDKVVEVEPGVVFGATGTNSFLASVTNNTVFFTNNLAGTAFGSGQVLQSGERLVLGPDANIWMFEGSTLYRINPLVSSSQSSILTRTSSSLMFNGGDMYLFGGSGSATLYKLASILQLPVSSVIISGSVVITGIGTMQ